MQLLILSPENEMRKVRFLLPALILCGGLAVSTVSYGKPEYTKKEKKACVFCHTNSKELNEAGKYYKEHNNSLEGYKAAQKK
jgi:hypothetical protein